MRKLEMCSIMCNFYTALRFLVALFVLFFTLLLAGCTSATPTQTAIPLATVTIGGETAVQFPFQSQSQQIDDLTLIEYPLASSQVDIDGSSEIVNQIWDAQTRSNTSGLTIAEANAIMRPFGYHLEDDKLYQDDVVLREIGTGLSTFLANQSKTNFVWAIHDSVYDGWLIHGKTIDTSYSFSSNFFIMPQFLEDELIVLHNYSGSDDPNAQLQVTINDQVVYSQGFDGPTIVTDCPVESLKVWNRHWILDMENQVVMDGKLLNKEFGHDAVFEWLLLNDKPLYFFRDLERYGLVYDGEELPVNYDEVKHQCESVNNSIMRSLRIERTDTTANFFAQRDGMWYYVILQVSNP